MSSIVIVSGSRTAMGGFQGSLASLTAPELGAAVEKDYKDFYDEAFYDAEGVYGGIVEWDWDNAGSYDYPDD